MSAGLFCYHGGVRSFLSVCRTVTGVCRALLNVCRVFSVSEVSVVIMLCVVVLLSVGRSLLLSWQCVVTLERMQGSSG